MSGIKLLGVEDARGRMLAAARPVPVEETAVGAAAMGRVLAEPLNATRDQPPFPAAAMDGYAVAADGLGDTERRLTVIGESAAGKGFNRPVRSGEAVRIFTGAPVPEGGAWVVPQENTSRDGDTVIMTPRDQSGSYIRAQGVDFKVGEALLPAGVTLDPWRIGLVAAAGRGSVKVYRRPRVAILSTGEELVVAGSLPGADQIFDSGSPSLSALVQLWGAEPIRLTPAGDNAHVIAEAINGVEVDLIVTVGGASVGDHDLVKPAMQSLGFEMRVESVAVRPGKPTWFGKLDDGRLVLGLPGNPASALVCAELFLRPLVDALRGAASQAPRIIAARTTSKLAANGPREHWMRARLDHGADGVLHATPLRDQDSSLLTVYASADALLRRPIGAAEVAPGDVVDVLPLMRS